MKNFILFTGSLIFYAWGEPVYVVLMLFSTVSDYIHGIWIEKAHMHGREKKAKMLMISSVIINLFMLGFFKYADFLIGTVNGICRTEIPLLNLPLPIGISFYTFQTMSYSIDVYRKKVPAQKNIAAFGAFVAMFPQLIAGPIVQYKTVAEQLAERKVTADDIAYGLRRFVVGLGKKVLLANQAGLLFETVRSWPAESLSMTAAWVGILFFAFQIYFDFSGYSDMAIGLGKMLGFHFPENFRYPYTAQSITDFWRRWHISLSSWFRDYVYIPLGGNKKGKGRQLFNIFIVWTLTGIWHGADWNFLLWGMWFAVFLMLEKRFLLSYLEKMPRIFRHLYTIFIVLGGWMMFALTEPGELQRFAEAAVGIGAGGLIGNNILYELNSEAVMLPVLLIGCTSLPAKLGRKLPGWAEIVSLTLLFLLSLAFIVDASYNPFLYFRF